MHIGGIQHEVDDLRREIRKKADDNEVHQINNNVSNLERAIRQLSSEIGCLESRMQELEANQIRE